jgi:hypothetical protein
MIDAASDGGGCRDGNRWLIYREQDDIIDYFYVSVHNRHGPEGRAVTYLLTLVGMPSIPDARADPAVFPQTVGGAFAHAQHAIGSREHRGCS